MFLLRVMKHGASAMGTSPWLTMAYRSDSSPRTMKGRSTASSIRSQRRPKNTLDSDVRTSSASSLRWLTEAWNLRVSVMAGGLRMPGFRSAVEELDGRVALRGGDVAREVGALAHPLEERAQARVAVLQHLHEPVVDEQLQEAEDAGVRHAHRGADEEAVAAAVVREHPLEVGEPLGQLLAQDDGELLAQLVRAE